MKRFSLLSLALICSILMGVSLTSCGDDPVVTNDFDKSALTSPMFLVELPDFTQADAAKNDFKFYTFNATKLAYGHYAIKNGKATVKCDYIYDWTLENGNLKFNNKSVEIKKVNLFGIKAFTIGNTAYYPSNNSVYGVDFEGILTKIGYDKARLWRALELSKTNGQAVNLDEVPKN